MRPKLLAYGAGLAALGVAVYAESYLLMWIGIAVLVAARWYLRRNGIRGGSGARG